MFQTANYGHSSRLYLLYRRLASRVPLLLALLYHATSNPVKQPLLCIHVRSEYRLVWSLSLFSTPTPLDVPHLPIFHSTPYTSTIPPAQKSNQTSTINHPFHLGLVPSRTKRKKKEAKARMQKSSAILANNESKET
ncbi:hypothetical protein EYC80_009464 [Monilinia laxa]|uniref:Uncharacterized protein n=1 Tax=Monilinia laxa TaxID=61186 RepID=A0A5N6JYB5_MONLA|nr:hypothetical protein EYC80_009464 [Monilinia laxa]